jgi:hypothetical protein
MAEPFTCTVCGRERVKRSHFLWLATAVTFLFGQLNVPQGPVCVQCAPRLATVGGRVLFGLLIVGLVYAIAKFPFK